jgi:hypothetical protein
MNKLTVTAWIEADHPSSERMETALAQWDVRPIGKTAASAFDAGAIGNPKTQGYYGAVFDGRRILFAPMQHAIDQYHAHVLAYDTWKDFQAPSSYMTYDAASTNGLDTRGYYGAAFDGHHVHFVPRKTEQARHSHLLRWDTTTPFDQPEGWQASDGKIDNCRQGAAFDGRYLYYAPGYDDEDPHSEKKPSGRVLRQDTEAASADPAGLAVFDMGLLHPQANCYDGACFDGRYIYFAPLAHPITVRYDTREDFTDPMAWEVFDATKTGMGICVGALFDGTYIYYAPYGQGRVVRYDTRGGFAEPRSWSSFDASAFRPCGYDGAFFDGRYLSFIPFIESDPDGGYQLHSRFLIYDTLGDFHDESSWQTCEHSQVDDLDTLGYNGGAFDGRYFYCAPWREKTASAEKHIAHGRILRLDTAVPGSTFNLQWSTLGHNGGLCAAVPGPTFLLQTTSGLRSVQAHRIFAAGRHHLAATYDAEFLRLYVDGEEIAKQAADGAIAPSTLPVTEGALASGGARLGGKVLHWEILPEALSADAIRELFEKSPSIPLPQ